MTLTDTSSVTLGAWPQANSNGSFGRIDPKKCWTWDPKERRAYRGYAKKQLPMWHAYRVELYPHYDLFTGITDEYGNPLTFPAAFRKRRRDDEPKGIVRILPED
jgi:hypothetical protein